MYNNLIKYNRVNGRVFDKKSDEWEHVRKLSESRIVQTYNPIIYKYRSIDISAYVDNFKEMPECGKYGYINNFDRTLDIIKNNRIYAPRVDEYYVAAEPPVRCGESHHSGQTEPPCY